jgi:transcriptional regulator with XRE-family HTH domain
VRALRTAQGLTQEQLAERAGMNELQVGHIERGSNDPKLTTVLKLARGLGITASRFWKDTNNEKLSQQEVRRLPGKASARLSDREGILETHDQPASRSCCHSLVVPAV